MGQFCSTNVFSPFVVVAVVLKDFFRGSLLAFSNLEKYVHSIHSCHYYIISWNLVKKDLSEIFRQVQPIEQQSPSTMKGSARFLGLWIFVTKYCDRIIFLFELRP